MPKGLSEAICWLQWNETVTSCYPLLPALKDSNMYWIPNISAWSLSLKDRMAEWQVIRVWIPLQLTSNLPCHFMQGDLICIQSYTTLVPQANPRCVHIITRKFSKSMSNSTPSVFLPWPSFVDMPAFLHLNISSSHAAATPLVQVALHHHLSRSHPTPGAPEAAFWRTARLPAEAGDNRKNKRFR